MHGLIPFQARLEGIMQNLKKTHIALGGRGMASLAAKNDWSDVLQESCGRADHGDLKRRKGRASPEDGLPL
jgi:hypothetical protein